MANPRFDPDELTRSETEAETGAETKAPVAAEQGFYARWSQHKLASLRGESLPQTLPQRLPQKSDDLKQVPASAQQQGTVFVDDSAQTPLPPIETLTERSDLKDFMSSHVADELRLRALHKVFHTPKFNVCDGLDDYAENYRVFEPLGDIITADLRYQLERLKQTMTTEPEAASVEEESVEEVNDPQIPMVAEDTADIEDHDDDAITSKGVQSDLALQVPKSE